MIPVLCTPDSTRTALQHDGVLSDVISCVVTEERNGVFELEMQYPVSGVNFYKIADRSIIMAIPSPYRDAQPFRVYKINKALNGVVTINAFHISYDLNFIPVMPFSVSDSGSVVERLPDYMAFGGALFEFSTDIFKTGGKQYQQTVPISCKNVFGGTKESFIEIYGGEILWDGWSVSILENRGENSNFLIAYGKNMTNLSIESSSEDVITGVLPYWEKEGVLITAAVVWIQNAAYQKALPVDFSASFDTQPSPAQLTQAAQSYIDENSIGTLPISTDVSFVDITKMSGYENISRILTLDLCDRLTIADYRYGIMERNVEIVKIVTNVLLERYDSLEIGTIRQNFAQTIVDMQNEINNLR